METATLAGGCFWCLEAVFDDLKGVSSVESGYMGGHLKDPTYADVCGGNTGHAEVVQIRFDPAQLGFRELLEVFFVIHDPTTLNRQGNDVGTQYRSVVFCQSPQQRAIAQSLIAELSAANLWPDPIVTEVAAEHRMYLPLAAIVAAAVMGAFLLGRRLIPSATIGAVVAMIVLISVVGVLGNETRDRNRVYWSAEGLWADTVAKRPGVARALVAGRHGADR